MSGVYFLVPTLLAVSVSMLIVRAGAIALMMTGMDFQKAKFQALSAFSGTGFTTREAERVVNNPRRRRIVSMLMIFGNAGIVAVIVAGTTSFATVSGPGIALNLFILAVGFGLIYLIAKRTPFARRWESFVEARLKRSKLFEEDATVDDLLHLADGYGVVRIQLFPDSALIGQNLAAINSELQYSQILGIERGSEWVPSPRVSRTLQANDRLVVYGNLDAISERFARKSPG